MDSSFLGNQLEQNRIASLWCRLSKGRRWYKLQDERIHTSQEYSERQFAETFTFIFQIHLEGIVAGYSYNLRDRLGKEQLWSTVNSQLQADVEFIVQGKRFSSQGNSHCSQSRVSIRFPIHGRVPSLGFHWRAGTKVGQQRFIEIGLPLSAKDFEEFVSNYPFEKHQRWTGD